MKNLIYILIFLPSLLFSQETKNMEFVGVRNITCESNQTLDFEIDEGHILKVLNVSHEGAPVSTFAYHTLLNNEHIYYTRYYNGSGANVSQLDVNFPFYLSEGIHTLYANGISTIYCLEFKLTTP